MTSQKTFVISLINLSLARKSPRPVRIPYDEELSYELSMRACENGEVIVRPNTFEFWGEEKDHSGVPVFWVVEMERDASESDSARLVAVREKLAAENARHAAECLRIEQEG